MAADLGLRLAAPSLGIVDALIVVLAVVVAALQLRRAQRETGRGVWFWRFMAFGTALWGAAQILRLLSDGAWTWAGHALSVLAGALLIGFLVPIIGAVALHPDPPPARGGPMVLVDGALLTLAIAFIFVRVVLVPRPASHPPAGGEQALALLSFMLAVWTAALWRPATDPAWTKAYGFLSVFAVVYGGLTVMGSSAGSAPASGELHVVWIVSFAVLGAAAIEPTRNVRVPATCPVLIAGAGPLMLDLALDAALPQASGQGHALHTQILLPFSALLTLGCALRLWLAERTGSGLWASERARGEEDRRAGRLAAMAAMSGPLVEEIQQSMADVVRCARTAVPQMGDKAERVLAQSRRAEGIVRDLAASLRPMPSGTRRDVDLAALVEATVQDAIDGGLGLQVSLEGMADLPPVAADAGALGAAVLHLARNAAQASPGGRLAITGERQGDHVVLRFTDDGAGVPAEIRHRIFDPFFTTRPVGTGVGLGLTLVHFVARDHGGSVVLEPREPGACFALRLPVSQSLTPHAASEWAWSAAAVLSAGMATLLMLLPDPVIRLMVGRAVGFSAALVAAAALARVALRRRGRERTFWGLLAAGPGLWTLAGVILGRKGSLGLSFGSAPPPWAPALSALVDLPWGAALLLWASRPRTGPASRRAWLEVASVYGLYVYLCLYLSVLPVPWAARDAGAFARLVWGAGLLRAAIAAGAFLFFAKASSRYWQGIFGRSALAFALWTLGQVHLLYAWRDPGPYSAGLGPLGWAIPFLFLAALGFSEGSHSGRPNEPEMHAERGLLWGGTVLLALAALPALDAFLPAVTHGGFESTRQSLARWGVALLGVTLALREALAYREASAARSVLQGTRHQLQEAERRSGLRGILGPAVHELASHLSAIRTLARLLLGQSDLTTRARTDVSRIQARAEMGARIMQNLLGLVRGSPRKLGSASLTEVVRDVIATRSPDLAEEGIELRGVFGAVVPPLPLDVPAMQQVLVGLIDNAAVAIRSTGRVGTVRIAVAQEGETVLVTVSDDGPGFPEAIRRRFAGSASASWSGPGLGLKIAREIVAQHEGTLAVRNRTQGGAQVEIRLPIAPAAARDNAG